MECNKDEAVRAKELAERKFSEREYADAKKLAVKALNLCPALDVRNHYRKLALTLHPDKNKSLGAEGAFKLVSEAWSMLSDKARRQAYNQNRSLKGFQHSASDHGRTQSEASCRNGFNNFNKNETTNVRNGNNNTRRQPTSAPPPKASTFWTICNQCKTHYEYLKIYLNHTLICPTCNEHFLAEDMPPPPNIFKSANRSSSQQCQNSQLRSAGNNPGSNCAVSQNREAGDSSGRMFNNTSSKCSPQSKMAGYGSRDGPSSIGAQAANVVQKASEKMTEDCERAPSIAEWERSQMSKRTEGSLNKVEKTLKKRRTDEIGINGDPGYMANNISMGHWVAGFGYVSESRKANWQTERTLGFSGITSRPHSMRELGMFEIRNMLIHRAQSDLREKVQEWRSTTEAKNTKKHKQNKRTISTLNDKTPNAEKHGVSALSGNQHLDSDSIKMDKACMTITVPDSDFHNFDLDRAENSFEEDQVWAAYDDDDGMPRYYARIHKVISLKPFKMRISWLNSRSNSELGPIDWIGSGFYKTCGDFRTGKHEITESLNSFSHKVKWTKGTRGVVRIFPVKGEVWALYRNWSPDWNRRTPDEVIHKYDMVEVVEDFDKGQGVVVTPLTKVAGFRTVFDRHGDPRGLMRIPKGELFRFSHQVPYHLLTGQEAHNAPKGCRELDPAATPLDLLYNTTEANEAPDGVGKRRENALLSSTEKRGFGIEENAPQE
ncbi:uncharacterized protein LOC129294565 isoform X2 [Prosopis cineraria]|uniref:uncharacterized protein LOC129294565 isoform X2 n=1 Tax=Prosopis cineraria TaxID=364024 RepID=UPI00240ED81B|nr:uncharacterized protein LOC129294565 isoform X2 [Prosopis cineraria]